MAYDNFRTLPNYPSFTTTRGSVRANCKFTLTTAGAVGTTVAPGADFTLTKNGTTGKYDLTFPPAVDVAIYVSLYSPTPTVNSCVVTAQDNTAGTATILLALGSTAAYGASGDVIHVRLFAQTEI